MKAYLDRTSAAAEPSEHDVAVRARDLTTMPGNELVWVPSGSNSAGTHRPRAVEAAQGTDRETALAEAAQFGVISLLAAAARDLAGARDAWITPRDGAAGLWSSGLGVDGPGIGAAGDGLGIGTGSQGWVGGSLGMTWGTWHTSGSYDGYHHFRGPRCNRTAHDDGVIARGPLTDDAVRRVVHGAWDSLARCASSDPVSVRLLVGQDGDVVALVSSANACIHDVFRGLTFPPSDAPTTVTYRIVFERRCLNEGASSPELAH